MSFYELISIGLYFLLMVLIGIYSYLKTKNSSDDFLIGGRKLGAAVTALSAGAADMSGWLLMGVPGAVYLSGISASWIAIGLTIGAYVNYLLIAPRLRIYTELANNSITLPVFFENRFKDKSGTIKIISSILILVFFTLYTSAGMVSGGRLFESAFGLDYSTGLIATSFVVVLYTFMGGFLAVSLTDFVQGTIMLIALILVPAVMLWHLDGLPHTLDIIRTKDDHYLDIFKGTSTISIISLLAWGLGYFGQPHILVRFMAIEKAKDLKQARKIGISWMILTMSGAILIGLFGIAYIAEHVPGKVNFFDNSKEQAETIFIYLARTLFHPLIGGFLLSAILAAVMSTISSQLLVTSSSLTEDIYKTFLHKNADNKRMMLVSRLSVLVVALVAFLLSLTPKDTILNLVGNAWAGFAAAFGPLVILSLMWRKITLIGAVSGMILGATTVLAWVYIPHDYKALYEIIPGFAISFLATVIISLLTYKANPKIEEDFNKMIAEKNQEN